MKRIILALTICSVAATGAAIAQEGPIKQRQALMKKNGNAVTLITAMFKGEKPYDGAATAEALGNIPPTLDQFITLFPEGSTSKDSDAKPDIWKNKADFDSLAAQVKSDSAKAATAAAGGMASLQPAFAALGRSCQACHEKYKFDR